jgi:hypothetical protein
MEDWPEGRSADPAAARERYDAGLRASRERMRSVFRSDTGDANTGLAVVIVATAVAGFLASPMSGVLVAGAFAALYLAALTYQLWKGVRGATALHRAYLFTFGWGQWL